MIKSNSKHHTKLAVILLVIPGLLAASSFIVLLVVNLIFNPTFWMTPDTEPVTPTPFYITALNGVFTTIGGIGLLSLLPGLVAGVYLLASKKRSITKNITS
jgi:hypothetical protein